MKNIKALGLIFLALLTGLAAAVYATGWISRQGGIASNKVVVAAVDIELGSRVNAQMLSTVDWPSGSVPSGTFSDIKALNDRVVKVGVLRGEAIMEGKLAPVGTQGGLSAVIASGKRAMTVRVNDVVGVAGFALPGNYVDVMVNAQQDKGKSEQTSQISKTVLEKVLVLAVAQEANRDDTKPKVVSAVTLELSLEDSEKLDLARSVGTLSLVLRNQMDKTTVATGGITKGQLFGEKEILPIATTVAATPPARPHVARTGPVTLPASQCVEVIQNAVRSLACF
ncbi:Flp pilus assembly protein CpaB [Variovorax sp. Root411]|uniref:Flp pilus assembly protein CpaB n=1 Tax=Variovorax sp. Root411 TaxID=1736530 RepID=UPI0006FB3217|nr:Flp pilus assembly protein CpaB [Variovorax sp. Root411]KQW57288.1 Flp pilus assembly protein CpaB [Variovorax sp. Root411]